MQILKLTEMYSWNPNVHEQSSALQHILREGKIHPDCYKVAQMCWTAADRPDKFVIWKSVIAPHWNWSIWVSSHCGLVYTEIWNILWQKSEKAWQHLFNIQYSFQSVTLLNCTFWFHNKTRTYSQDILNILKFIVSLILWSILSRKINRSSCSQLFQCQWTNSKGQPL